VIYVVHTLRKSLAQVLSSSGLKSAREYVRFSLFD
jgi:hypothetical protein